jgi:hypothetical protein
MKQYLINYIKLNILKEELTPEQQQQQKLALIKEILDMSLKLPQENYIKMFNENMKGLKENFAEQTIQSISEQQNLAITAVGTLYNTLIKLLKQEAPVATNTNQKPFVFNASNLLNNFKKYFIDPANGLTDKLNAVGGMEILANNINDVNKLVIDLQNIERKMADIMKEDEELKAKEKNTKEGLDAQTSATSSTTGAKTTSSTTGAKSPTSPGSLK